VVEYITKKIPKNIDVMIKRLQAKYQLITGRKVSEGKIVEIAIIHELEHVKEEERKNRKKYNLDDIRGMFKGDKKFSSKEYIQKTVYGE